MGRLASLNKGGTGSLSTLSLSIRIQKSNSKGKKGIADEGRKKGHAKQPRIAEEMTGWWMLASSKPTILLALHLGTTREEERGNSENRNRGGEIQRGKEMTDPRDVREEIK